MAIKFIKNMEILIDRVKTIENEIYRFREEERTLWASIASTQERSAMIDLSLDAVSDLMMKANFACADFELEMSNKNDGSYLRVFNGKYWEHCGSYDVRDAVMKYLRQQGMSKLLSYFTQTSMLVHNIIVSTLKKKILHPRLTLMCFRNGVVDFARIDHRPMLKSHRAKYDVIKMYDFKFDPFAYRDAVIWKNFLGEPIGRTKNENGILPEEIKRKQLQLFLGALLIPRSLVKFEYFMIMQGTGGNGKSVIFQILELLFGKEEVCSLDISQFCRGGDEKLRAVASLVGKRMLYCPEELVKSLKNIQGLKSLVSGETQQYRKLGGDIESLYDVPIIMFNTNKRWHTEDFVPIDDPHDDSMSRRAQIINFSHTVPVSLRDTELARKLDKEKSGIFAWIVKGYMELKANGYRMPENVAGKLELVLAKAKATVRTVGNRHVNGTTAIWVERCHLEPESSDGLIELVIPTTILYNHFIRFCQDQSFPLPTPQKFGRDLVSMGFRKKLIGGYSKEAEPGYGGRNYYFLYTDLPSVVHAIPSRKRDEFLRFKPSLVDDVKADLFEGKESQTDEEYAKSMSGYQSEKDDDED